MTLRGLAIAGVAVVAAAVWWGRVGTRGYRLGDVGTIRLPKRARLEGAGRPVLEEDGWVAFRFNRFHPWAMGSSTPYRAVLLVTIHEPGSTNYLDALRRAEQELNGGATDWRPVAREDGWVIGSGRYQVNLLDEPTWRLEHWDPARRVGALWQVYQRDWDLARAKVALAALVASVVISRDPDFAEIRDRPRREAAENARKIESALARLRHRGYPLTAGVAVTRDGVTAEFDTVPEPRLTLFRLTRERLGSIPALAAQGQRTWADSGWFDRLDGDRGYYPSTGIAARLALLPRPGPHHYLIRTIRLEVLDEADYRIDEFLAYAATVAEGSPLPEGPR